MRQLAKFLATAGGVGEVPVAPGTAGSAVGALMAWLTASQLPLGWSALGASAVFLLGVAASDRTSRELGAHDPSVVVIDEVVGMWMVFAVLPQAIAVPWLAALAFVLFRAFDTLKPPPLRRLERLPGGWGIMLDDLGAAAYACVILTLVQWRSG